MSAEAAPAPRPPRKLFYGWVVVAVAFVTMGVAVSARTGFGLLLPPIIEETGWDVSVASHAFSVGFLASTAVLPVIGWAMVRYGPRAVIPLGGLLTSLGYLAAREVTTPLEFYAALGLLAINGSMAMSYISHSMFLPNWFVRNRGLAIGIAFGGVGVLGAVLLPALQWLIETVGWREACLWIAACVAIGVIPLNLIFARTRPEDLGLRPDGDAAPEPGAGPSAPDPVVDRVWARREWTLALAMRTGRFWWLSSGYFCMLFIWYAVQQHQTLHLLQSGFDGVTAASALGMVALFGVAGQIGIGGLSDRIGREAAWAIALSGFAITALLLLALEGVASPVLLWSMVVAQGLLGNGAAALFGAMPAEIFQGRRFPAIFAAITLIANTGAACGVSLTGWILDVEGGYATAWWLCLALSAYSAFAIWMASPRKVRLVAGMAKRRAAAQAG
ncbi:MAG: MFS transporter [Pseudomonadota bacterium]